MILSAYVLENSLQLFSPNAECTSVKLLGEGGCQLPAPLDKPVWESGCCCVLVPLQERFPTDFFLNSLGFFVHCFLMGHKCFMT